MSNRLGRICFGLTAALVAIALAIQIPITANRAGHFTTPLSRVVNIFFYFTIDSNIIVGITCALLAINLNRPSTVFRVFRLTGVTAIAVTGVIFNTILAGLQHLTGWAKVADDIFHIIVPIVAILGWLLFGPRGMTSWRIMWLSVIPALVWIAVTLIRGPIVDWYPYPFLEVPRLGYPKVLENIAAISILFLGLAATMVAFDKWLTLRLDRPRTNP
jgi:hypothetical protein